ncbi:hypothetical protein F8388_019308 [Cannabis sativa]|uniref:Zinc knuckle CX2CX4HX4C domain-containing protein n=1 Tax=Cannabis sativa TaxID=3483 RepID=A0A7J6FQZ2_CANSA|nr:hypothetical protein F8388_019308 [Cannabis sativa]
MMSDDPLMEPFNTTNAHLKGKCFFCLETTVTLTPSVSSLKALTRLCLYGKLVAPMVVDEGSLADYVVSVVALAENAKTFNYFEFGFEVAEDRLGPSEWTMVLSRIYSRVTGLGSENGKVVRVDLENDKPALWLRVLVDIEYKKLLVSGCFFDLASGEKQWLQFKFEKVGIFCYNYGVLGHQHKGCNLTTPVMIVDKEDKYFPMFGPWLSPSSAYADVFSGPKMNDVRGLLATNPEMKLRVFTPVKAIDGSGGDRLKGPGILSTRLPRR